MQVITLDHSGLESHAARLAAFIRRGHPAPFDATVAIRNGGTHVCDSLCRYMPKESIGLRSDVKLQRASTARKSGKAARLLRRLPRPLLDLMRMGESIVLQTLHKLSNKNDTSQVTPGKELSALLDSADAPEILIVDDAVDSGMTLEAVRETLLRLNSRAHITTAVITVTTSNPDIRPDFSLYSDHTLIRFPWSKDFHR